MKKEEIIKGQRGPKVVGILKTIFPLVTLLLWDKICSQTTLTFVFSFTTATK